MRLLCRRIIYSNTVTIIPKHHTSTVQTQDEKAIFMHRTGLQCS